MSNIDVHIFSSFAETIHFLPGHLLDSFARAALWEAGLDYLHGTGHGVGCFLNVHEGPCGISYKTFADEPLEAGMIVSDGMTRDETELLGLLNSKGCCSCHYLCKVFQGHRLSCIYNHFKRNVGKQIFDIMYSILLNNT